MKCTESQKALLRFFCRYPGRQFAHSVNAADMRLPTKKLRGTALFERRYR